jgi:hypothetical protein
MRRTLLATVIAALASATIAGAEDPPKMVPSHDVLLAAATLPSHATNELRFAAIPGDAIDDALFGAFPIRPDDLEAALPPPPQKVTLENSYAPVIFSHAGHLARRTSCKACHGEGPVRKIGRFQPKVAHDLCRSCHVQVAKGPTACTGCHHKKPAPVMELAKGPATQNAIATVERPAGWFDQAAAVQAYEVAAAWPAPARGQSADLSAVSAYELELPYSAARRTVWAGGSMLAGSGMATSAALAVGVNFRESGYQFSETLEWSGMGGGRRTLGLLGGGIVRPVHPQWTAHILGVGGFDAIGAGWASFLPVAGARAGLEWTSPRRFVHSFDVSVTALADLTRGHDPSGTRTGGAVLSVCVSAGLDLSARPRR